MSECIFQQFNLDLATAIQILQAVYLLAKVIIMVLATIYVALRREELFSSLIFIIDSLRKRFVKEQSREEQLDERLKELERTIQLREDIRRRAIEAEERIKNLSSYFDTFHDVSTLEATLDVLDYQFENGE